jgi:hypothetical protein
LASLCFSIFLSFKYSLFLAIRSGKTLKKFSDLRDRRTVKYLSMSQDFLLLPSHKREKSSIHKKPSVTVEGALPILQNNLSKSGSISSKRSLLSSQGQIRTSSRVSTISQLMVQPPQTKNPNIHYARRSSLTKSNTKLSDGTGSATHQEERREVSMPNYRFESRESSVSAEVRQSSFSHRFSCINKSREELGSVFRMSSSQPARYSTPESHKGNTVPTGRMLASFGRTSITTPGFDISMEDLEEYKSKIRAAYCFSDDGIKKKYIAFKRWIKSIDSVLKLLKVNREFSKPIKRTKEARAILKQGPKDKFAKMVCFYYCMNFN